MIAPKFIDGSTTLFYASKPFARFNSGGEFDLLLESGDRVDRQLLSAWKASETHQEGRKLVLSGVAHLPLFTTDLLVTVTYESVTPQVLKKTIRMVQNNIPRLFVSLKNSLEPLEPPVSYWSFDHADHPGGPAYGILTEDVFPAAGFVLGYNRVVGLLTASGWDNGWNRFGWRRSQHGNLPSPLLSDPAILRTATPEDRLRRKHAVSLTLGESYPLHLISIESADDSNAEYTFFGRQGCTYAILIEACGAISQSMELRAESASLLEILQDNRQSEPSLPVAEDWALYTFRTQALPSTGLYSLRLVRPRGSSIQARGLRLYETVPEPSPCQELRQGVEMVRKLFIFVEDMPPTPRNLRLRSQTALAEGLDFSGTDLQKVLVADVQMLTWQAEPGVHEPLVVPSIYYFEMYFRDAFWILNGVRDRFLNENILRRVGETISPDGNIGNIITAYHGSIEYTHNELAYLYLLWSFLNRKRFGLTPDLDKVHRVAAFIQKTFDPDGDGIVLVNNPQSCIDVMWQNRPCRFAVSQGYYAVTLRAAKEMGVDIPEPYIYSAEQAYRSYYADDGDGQPYFHTFPDNTLGPGGQPVGILSLVDFEPEFLSLYLFNHPMLEPEIVHRTLDRYPVFEHGLMPLLVKTDGTFFTKESHPFGGGSFWKPGTYANGGSWLRQQIITLAVGQYYRWPRAREWMELRLQAELNFDPDNPLSREYLACTGNPSDSAPHRVFGWNIFVLAVQEWLSSIEHLPLYPRSLPRAKRRERGLG